MRLPPETAKMVLVSTSVAGAMKKKNYDRGFIQRVRIARESANLSRDDMARILGVKPDTYARYELKIMMPHHHIPTFAKATGISLTYLFGSSADSNKAKLKSV